MYKTRLFKNDAIFCRQRFFASSFANSLVITYPLTNIPYKFASWFFFIYFLALHRVL